MPPTDVEEQPALFPELDKDNKQHRQLMKLAKGYAKLRDERKEYLTSAKSNEDEAMGALVSAMHEAELKCFRFEGVTVELETKEKAKVKMDLKDDEDDGDDD